MRGFDFGHGERLILLAVPVLLAAARFAIVRRNRGAALTIADDDLLDEVIERRPARWQSVAHLVGVLAGMTLLVIAAADPRRQEPVASERSQVVLALDVSNSMRATDVTPNRLEAAQRAAVSFVEASGATTEVGLVTFSGTATPVVAPTTDNATLTAAILDAETAPSTAIGEAVFASLGLLDTAGFEPVPGRPGPGVVQRVGTIVVLTDGKTTAGRSDTDAAAAAAAAGVAVHTIAFGTPDGVVTLEDGSQVSVPVDRDALEALAETTGGISFTATTGAELTAIFDDLATDVVIATRPVSIASGVAAVGLLILAAAMLYGMWFASRLW